MKPHHSLITLWLFFYFPFCVHGLACCIFVSEGDQLLVSNEVSPQGGHPEGHHGVSPTGLGMVCRSQSRNELLLLKTLCF